MSLRKNAGVEIHQWSRSVEEKAILYVFLTPCCSKFSTSSISSNGLLDDCLNVNVILYITKPEQVVRHVRLWPDQYWGQCWCGVASTIQACTCLLVKCMYKIAGSVVCTIQMTL